VETVLSLEAADDLALGESFFGAPLDVVTSARVGDHADHDDAPQGLVGPAVAAAVEALAHDQPGGGVDGGTAPPQAPALDREHAIRLLEELRTVQAPLDRLRDGPRRLVEAGGA
jgi:hypothetical protein